MSFTRRYFAAAAAGLAAFRSRGLLGWWKLDGDAKDYSGAGRHGEDRGKYVEVPDHPSLGLGAGDFSIAARIFTGRDVDDVIGDIASKYDPVSRRGFNFGVQTNHVTFSPANWRHLHFGVDSGRTGEWQDCGRPGNCIYAMGLAVHDGGLYAGTCEAGASESGHVYRYAGGTTWIDCGSPDKANSISSLAVHEGKLYVASSSYNLAGSSLPVSANQNPGGRVFRYQGDRDWADCGRLGESVSVSGMAVFRGKLHASSLYQPAGTFRYEGGSTWTPCGTPGGKRVEAMAVFNGALYGTGYDGGEVYRYDGSAWTTVGRIPGMTQTYSLAVYGGKLYVSTWPEAKVFRLDGDGNWTDCGRLGEELESMGMAVYNGALYAGTLPLAEVYRYDGGRTWTRTGRLDHTPGVRYRRAWSMAVYQGRLFCGTLPSGRVLSLEAGKSATHDRQLPPGWHTVAAVRQRSRLRLCLDGRTVATASLDGAWDVSNTQPLKIGFGSQNYFQGKIRDLRLYGRALDDSELR